MGISTQHRQCRQGTGRNDIGALRRQILDPAAENTNRKAHLPRRFAQERGLAQIGLHQVHAQIRVRFCRNRRADKAGEPTAASQIKPGLGANRHLVHHLRRIKHMPRPDLRDRRSRDQIDRFLPLDQQRGENFQAVECFT